MSAAGPGIITGTWRDGTLVRLPRRQALLWVTRGVCGDRTDLEGGHEALLVQPLLQVEQHRLHIRRALPNALLHGVRCGYHTCGANYASNAEPRQISAGTHVCS